LVINQLEKEFIDKMKLDKKLQVGLKDFFDLRHLVTSVNNLYMKRLYDLFGITQQKKRISVYGKFYFYSKKIVLFIFYLVKIIIVFPCKWKQVTLFLRKFKNVECDQSVFLALSTKRNDIFKNDNEKTREKLNDLFQPIPSEVDMEFRDKIQEDQWLFLFEPDFICNVRYDFKKLMADKIVLLDNLFLFILGARKLQFRDKLNCLSQILSKSKRAVCFRPIQLSAAFLLLAGMSFIEKISRNTYLILATSNSFQTEFLRIFCNQSDRCTRVLELEHGIMFKSLEKFYLECCKYKSQLIAQIPKLPKSSKLNQYYVYQDAAVNMYLRYCEKYNINRSTSGVHQGIEKSKFQNKKIITFFGSGVISDDYDVFLVEEAILKIFLNCINSENILLQYLPHPGNKTSSSFERFLSVSDITLAINPIVSYRISAGAIALISATLIEGYYYGCYCFTPTISDDNIFLDEYFNLVNNPLDATYQAVEIAVKDFILLILNNGKTAAERDG
jgi:hypothetical protein